jgi:UDP-N-acetylmuramate dehydrogenase
VQVRRDARLGDLTTLAVGGPVDRLVEVTDAEELVAAVREADEAGRPLLVLGGGSNVVAPEEGWPGDVVAVRTRGIARDGGTLEVHAGEPWDDLVAATVADRLAGIEALSGIPGSTGATPVQNVGAYGQEVAQTITAVRVWDRAEKAERSLTPAECGFAYRDSRLKREPGRFVVLTVTFALTPGELSMPVTYAELARRLGVELGERAPLDDVRAAVLELRRGKGMVLDPADHDTWSAGSFFTNPVVAPEVADEVARRVAAADQRPVTAWPMPDGRVKLSAAALIERAGVPRGHPGPDAPVRVSTRHTLALTNRGDGTTAQLLALARDVRDRVERAFGVCLHPEPVLVGCALD